MSRFSYHGCLLDYISQIRISQYNKNRRWTVVGTPTHLLILHTKFEEHLIDLKRRDTLRSIIQNFLGIQNHKEIVGKLLQILTTLVIST